MSIELKELFHHKFITVFFLDTYKFQLGQVTLNLNSSSVIYQIHSY